jgi:hypothetical protein
MSKTRIFVYLLILFALVAAVIMKQKTIIAKRNQKIVSTVSEWQAHGKPVVVDIVKKDDVKVFTKMTITAISDGRYEAFVPKIMQKKLDPGQPVFIDNETHEPAGQIISVSNEIDLDTGLYPVVLEVNQAQGSPQDRLIVYGHTGTYDNVICVPNDVVSQKNDQDYVWVARGGRARKRVVEIQKRNGYGAIIRNGLQEDDRVVVRGFTKLYEGDKLRVSGSLRGEGKR